MTNSIITVKLNDTSPYTYIIKDENKNIVDLTDCTVNLIISTGKLIVVNRQITVSNATSGEVEFSFIENEIDKSGLHLAEFEVTYSDNSKETFPKSDYIKIRFDDTLKSKIGSEDTYTLDGGSFEDSITSYIILDGGDFA